MPWNLLILPLAAGYYLLTRYNGLKYLQQRLDRQRLVFDAVLLGILTLIAAFTVRNLVDLFIPGTTDSLYQYLPINSPYAGTSISTIILAYSFTQLGNRMWARNHKRCVANAISKVGNELELLLTRDDQLIEFSLENEKFYVGWVKELPIPGVSSFVRLYPFVSGYRDEQRRLVFTTDYSSVYAGYIERGEIKDIDELNVDLVIPVNRIMTAKYFDFDMYDRFNDIDKD